MSKSFDKEDYQVEPVQIDGKIRYQIKDPVANEDFEKVIASVEAMEQVFEAAFNAIGSARIKARRAWNAIHSFFPDAKTVNYDWTTRTFEVEIEVSEKDLEQKNQED